MGVKVLFRKNKKKTVALFLEYTEGRSRMLVITSFPASKDGSQRPVLVEENAGWRERIRETKVMLDIREIKATELYSYITEAFGAVTIRFRSLRVTPTTDDPVADENTLVPTDSRFSKKPR